MGKLPFSAPSALHSQSNLPRKIPPEIRLCPNSGAIADVSQLPLGADSVEKDRE
jgi:hypothetical protein